MSRLLNIETYVTEGKLCKLYNHMFFFIEIVQ